MTKEELAAMLNGREIGHEISDREEAQAKRDGLVVFFGASDDLCELRGAIYEEIGAWNGCTVMIGEGGRLLAELDRGDVDVLTKHGVMPLILAQHDAATKIQARWCEDPGYSWIFTTTAPHSAFDVMEGDDKFCRGIVIDIAELPKP